MKKVSAFFDRVLTAGAIAAILASCSSSRTSLVNPPSVDQTPLTYTSVAVEAAEAPAAAQGAPATEVYASAAQETATVAQTSTLEKASLENKPAAALNKEARKASLPARLAAKALVKKLEKAGHKFDAKKEKAAKVDQQIRTGIIVAAVGLGLIVLSALVGGSGVLYPLGIIGLLAGGVIILLAALDVI